MAYCNKDQVLVTNYTFAEVFGASPAGSITPPLPFGAAKPASGDVIIIVIAARRSAGNWTENGTSEYTMIQGTEYNSTQHTIAWKVASGSDVARQFKNTSGSGAETTAVVMVWKDAHQTTPIPDRLFATIGSFPHTFGSGLTTTYDNSAVVYIATHTTTAGSLITAKMDGAREIAQSVGGTTWTSTFVGEKTKTVAGTAANITAWSTDNTEAGACLVFAVRNASNGIVYPEVSIDVDSGSSSNEFPNLFGSIGANNSKTITWATPDAWLGTGGTINGYSMSTTADTVTTNNTGVTYTYAPFTQLSNSTNYATSPKWTGAGINFTSTVNMSGKFFGLIWSSGLGSSQVQVQEEGLIVVFKDNQGTPAWAAFTLHKKTKLIAGFEYTSVIALGSGKSTPTYSSGSIDWTNINGVAFFKLKTNGFATTWSQLLKHGILFSKATVTGGYSGSPAKFSDLVLPFNSWDKGGFIGQQAVTQVQLACNLQIGDGTNITTWDSSGQSVAFPPSYGVNETSSAQDKVNVLPSALNITVKTSSTDLISLTADIIGTSQEQDFTIDAASNTAATLSLAGASVVGFNPTLKSGFDLEGVTFSGCAPVNTKGADLNNCLITDTTATSSEAAVVVDTSGSTLTGCTIDVTGTSAGYHLGLGTSVTSITLVDHVFTGTPGTDKVHVRKTSGTVTISISGSTTLAAGDVTSEGATVSIVSDPVYQSVVVSGLTVGTRVQIYDTTSNTELANATSTTGSIVFSSGGTVATWTDPSTASASRAIRLRLAYVSGATAKTFIEANIGTCGTTAGTASVSYLANQVNDTVYNNNAITGSGVTGVTFTDSSPDVINIDVAANTISWKSIYAAWVYYSFTSTGIATDIDYIDAVDEANYVLSNMKVKNTSSPSEPLEVTGGYGRDAITNAAIDLVDTSGGTLVFAPDHVVSYAVGSGVTSQDKTDIASAVLTAAASAPIAANIKKVADTTVNGSGTAANPWGP